MRSSTLRFLRCSPISSIAAVLGPVSESTHSAIPGHPACYTERIRPKNDLYRCSARRRSSVETSSPRSHWPSSLALSAANISANRFIASATRLSACSTTRRGSSTKLAWMVSHWARKSFASPVEKSGTACLSKAGAGAAPADEPPPTPKLGAATTRAPGRAAAPADGSQSPRRVFLVPGARLLLFAGFRLPQRPANTRARIVCAVFLSCASLVELSLRCQQLQRISRWK